MTWDLSVPRCCPPRHRRTTEATRADTLQELLQNLDDMNPVKALETIKAPQRLGASPTSGD
jgi:hypothetical protein